MKIKGMSAIVTGGASGIGQACVQRLLKSSAQVIVMDLQKAAMNYNSKSYRWIETDVSDASSVKQSLQASIEAFSSIRICINCAGILHAKRLINMNAEEFKKVIAVNVVGTFNVLQQSAQHMITLDALKPDQERGVIINTASIAAYEGQIGQTAYSASKAAVIGMMLPMVRELAGSGVRVMTIAPGVVNTPMLQSLSAESRVALEASVPFPKRLVAPDEFARLALHIVRNSMLNGETIRLDGALRLQAK